MSLVAITSRFCWYTNVALRGYFCWGKSVMLGAMVYVVIGLFGLAFGSFTNALAWRVYEQSKAKKSEKRRLSITRGRSMCVHCHHELAANDLVPVFSWLCLRGRCRYCNKSISWQYPLVEVLFTLLLLALYGFWPVALVGWQWVLFVLWVPLLVVGMASTIIDIRYQLLPNRLMYSFGLLAALFALSNALISHSPQPVVSSAIGGAVLFAVFYGIYQVSSGKWIGGGDVRLVAFMGILLGWQKGVLAVVLASYLASAVVLVIVLMGKYHKKMRIAFGPFLLLATYLTFMFGDAIIDTYRRFTGV